VRRLDAAFYQWVVIVAASNEVKGGGSTPPFGGVLQSQRMSKGAKGGVKPPQSKVPSARRKARFHAHS